jgi:hypothetical protein
MKRTICILTALLMVTIIVITGCSRATSTATALSASQIFSKSYDNMQAVNSFHFVLDHIGGGTPISMGVEMTKAEGDIARPDKLQTTIFGTAMGTSIEVKLVTMGGKTLMTNPLSGNWEVPPDQFKVLSVFDPGTGIAAIIKGITTPSSLDDEQLGDILCYHLKGDIASETLSPLTGSAVAGVVVNAEVWIGKEDFLVRQAKLTGKITEGEKEGIVRTLAFTSFNQNVDITLPQ